MPLAVLRATFPHQHEQQAGEGRHGSWASTPTVAIQTCVTCVRLAIAWLGGQPTNAGRVDPSRHGLAPAVGQATRGLPLFKRVTWLYGGTVGLMPAVGAIRHRGWSTTETVGLLALPPPPRQVPRATCGSACLSPTACVGPKWASRHGPIRRPSERRSARRRQSWVLGAGCAWRSRVGSRRRRPGSRFPQGSDAPSGRSVRCGGAPTSLVLRPVWRRILSRGDSSGLPADGPARPSRSVPRCGLVARLPLLASRTSQRRRLNTAGSALSTLGVIWPSFRIRSHTRGIG